MPRDFYFLYPILVAALIGVVLLLLRWAFSGTKSSLVRRTDYSPADRDKFGLLVPVRTVRTYAEAQQLVNRLTAGRIRATAARTKEQSSAERAPGGWTVYVWPDDEQDARDLLGLS